MVNFFTHIKEVQRLSKEFGKNVRGGPPETEKFDMLRPPVRPKAHLMPIAWSLSYFNKWTRREKMHRIGMDGLKPPYILLCNHNAFFDFSIMISAIHSSRAFYTASVDGFIGREELMRGVGVIPKRKYTMDVGHVRKARRILDGGGIFVIYAEARYSLCGSTEMIPGSIGQLAKRMGVPVVTLCCHGHHLLDPFWSDHKLRRVKGMETFMTRIYTAQELEAATAQEVNEKIRAHLQYDDFRWQSKNRVKIDRPNRAQGLHKPLYQCPKCMAEYKMDSRGAQLFCGACGKAWTLSEYGELSADGGETEFAFPTDWYQWEREQVRREVRAGDYRFDCQVDVNDLPNAKGFVHMGRGRLMHDLDGFRLTGARDYDSEPFSMSIPAASQPAVHVEYDYCFGNSRDCVDLNTLEDTWYCFPEGQDFSVTKLSLATEEIYEYLWEQRREIKVEDLIAVLGTYSDEVKGIGPDCVLATELGLNSVELFDFFCEIEERFGISIPDQMLPGLATARDIAQYILDRTGDMGYTT